MSESRCPWRIKTDGGQVRRCQLDEPHPVPLTAKMPWAHHGREMKTGVEFWSEEAPGAFNPEAQRTILEAPE